MKRLRDDVFSNSQIKRPFGSSRAESYALILFLFCIILKVFDYMILCVFVYVIDD